MSIDYDFIKVQVSFLVFRYKGASKFFFVLGEGGICMNRCYFGEIHVSMLSRMGLSNDLHF